MDILTKFKNAFNHLKEFGLVINGIAEIDYDSGLNVISVSHPFIFDNRLLPKEFNGFHIRSGISGELPIEFDNDNGWNPDNFEKFVDRANEEIRIKLKNPKMTREEMLDALCFGDFKEHKKQFQEWIEKGKI